MPLPIEICVDPTLCCSTIVDDGQAILQALITPLYECFGFDPDTDECDPPFTTFFGYGQPATAYHDYLTTWIEFIGPDFANVVNTSRFNLAVDMRIQWIVRLSLSGYPVFSNDPASIVNPPLDALDTANKVMTALATVMMVTLAGTRLVGCDNIHVERFDPAVGGGDVLGGDVGATIRISYGRRI